MFVMHCNISIGEQLKLNYCHSVEIESSWKTLADTCSIKLPSLQKQLARQVKVGDAVSVDLGYDGQMHREFTGYVAKTNNSIPFTLECEDAMWQLKRKPAITKTYEETTLKAMLTEIVPGSQIDVPEIVLKPFCIDNKTPAQVLQQLKDDYGLVAYYNEGVLYCGLAYLQPGTNENANFHLEKNIVTHSLEYIKKEDVKLKVKAISINGQNEREEVELGDEEGETRTLHYYNLTKEQLKTIATKELEKLKYSGFRGELTTFGQPFVKHSWSATIASKFLEAEAQPYAVDRVMTSFNDQGFRRKLAIGSVL